MKKTFAIIIFLFVCLAHTAGLGFATFGLDALRLCVSARENAHITETFSYDNNGALINWVSGTNTLSLAYNALDQITNIAPASAMSTFSYDALGNRVQTSTNTVWVIDHADPLKRPLIECDDFGVILRHYIWSENRLLGFIDANGVLTVAHSDDFSSIIALTDTSGNVLYSANYGPHGEDWGHTGVSPTPFTWLGGYGVMSLDNPSSVVRSPLKLYLTRHRLYSATLNRFLSSDPLGLEGGFNLYEYGLSNPMMYIDPLGLCAQSVERNFFDNFALGFMVGDFADDLGWGGIAGQIVAGLIPVYGQIADSRDLIANGSDFWNEPSWSSTIGVAGAVVGFVPLVGDAAKAGIRSAANAASDAGKAVVKNAGDVTKMTSHQLKKAGIKEEAFKKEFLGTEGGKYNISKDTNTGELILTPVKRGSLPNQHTGRYIDEF